MFVDVLHVSVSRLAIGDPTLTAHEVKLDLAEGSCSAGSA